MKYQLVAVGLFYFIANSLTAQKAPIGDTIFYNKLWQEVDSKKYAEYARLYTLQNTLVFQNDFYCPENQLKKRGALVSFKPIKYHGTVYWFYKNGNLSRQAVYNNQGEKIGIETAYHKNGKPSEQTIHKDTLRLTGQIWNEEGDPLLTNGTGEVSKYRKKRNSYFHRAFQDSICIETYERRMDKNDTLYEILAQKPTYKGGMAKFYAMMKNQMNYPIKARKRGIEGKVFVEFIVNKKGKTEEVKTIKGIHNECDNEAERVLRGMNNWNPPIYRGKPVKARMVLPVIFKLTK